MFGVEDFNIANGLDIASLDNAGAFLADNHAFRAIAFHADSDFLDVEHHVGNVFTHTGDGREFMQHAVNLHSGYRSTLQR